MRPLAFALKKPRLVLGALANLRSRLEHYATVEETFLQQVYHPLFRVLKEGTVLIDIGAFIGDTAIYFAQSPMVSTVVGFEPIESSYRWAVRNIEASPFERKIRMVNAAVGGTKRMIEVGKKGSAVSRLEGKGHRVRVETIDDIIRGQTTVAIKCDCEGEEIEIFAAAQLDNVYAIQLEYHDTRAEMIRILGRRGFKIDSAEEQSGTLYKSIGHKRVTGPMHQPGGQIGGQKSERQCQ